MRFRCNFALNLMRNDTRKMVASLPFARQRVHSSRPSAWHQIKYLKIQNEMKDIVITLNKESLTYSIDYMTYKVAKVHFSDQSPELAAEVSSTPSDKDYMDELTASGLENVRSELRWCVAGKNRVAGNDCVCPNVGEYDIVLRVGDGNGLDPQTLGRMIHDYVAYYVAYRYLLLTAPSVAASFAALAEAELNKVYMHVREEVPTRKPLLWK